MEGYELSKGKYVEITDEELEALEAEANRNVEIEGFVPVKMVDPECLKNTYKPYRLIAQAMAQEVASCGASVCPARQRSARYGSVMTGFCCM